LKTDYVKVERYADVKLNKSYIRAINYGGQYFCKICYSAPARYRCVVMGNDLTLCSKCMTTFALITQNYFLPEPSEHFIYGREPDVFMYPTTTTIYNLLCPYFETRKILTIKYLRYFTGLGLRDAKHQIDYWQAGHRGWMEDDFELCFIRNLRENRRFVVEAIDNFRKEIR